MHRLYPKQSVVALSDGHPKSIYQAENQRMTTKIQSPYSAAITGGGFLYEETLALLPLLESPNRERLLKDEALHNNVMNVNAETSRKRFIAEIKRRYLAMPSTFWDDWKAMDTTDRRAALFLVILKTYKILFDLHINVTIRKWRSAAQTIDLADIMMELEEIACRDSFVDSWSPMTKKKISSAYLSILRKVGMLDDTGLHPLKCSNYTYYLLHGESWFLEACLLQPYEIEDIKKMAS